MALNKLQHGTCISATAAGTTSTVATIAGITGSTMYVTDIAGSTDLAGGLITVKQGSTTIWQVQVPANGSFQQQFQAPLVGAVGASVSLTVTGTSASNANITAVYL